MAKKPVSSKRTRELVEKTDPVSGTVPKNDSDKVSYDFVFLERDIPTFYINNAHFSVSEMEMKIDLCEIQSAVIETDIKKISVTPKARIYLSWPFALRFMSVMKQQFDTHQKQMTEAVEEMKKRKQEREYAATEPSRT